MFRRKNKHATIIISNKPSTITTGIITFNDCPCVLLTDELDKDPIEFVDGTAVLDVLIDGNALGIALG